MSQSVENICNQLARFRLLETDAIRNLRQRWLTEAGSQAEDSARFGKWLVANRFLTEFQAALLLRGSGELLRCEDYVLMERIGQGRMAGVYRAVHNLGQVVAIKVLPPSKAANPQALARFQREARLAAQLDHPNVVRTYQQGITKAGLNYIVMELLDGEALDDTLKRRKRLPVREAVHVVLQALDGLQHIFEKDMVHRDLKTGNLMLVSNPRPGQPDTTLAAHVKILDIGLGRALFNEGEPALGDRGDLTTDGAVLGTPAYMAPEQARNPHTADIRADLYSLGCVLYECLAGAPPFADDNFMRQVIRHATETPQPLATVNPEVPKELQAVVDTLLAKDPARRYATPELASRALQAVPGVVPIKTRTTEPGPVLRSYLAWVAAARTSAMPAPAPAPVEPASVPAAYRELAATVPMAIVPAVALAQPLAAPVAPPISASAKPANAAAAPSPPMPTAPKPAPSVPSPAERPAFPAAPVAVMTVPPPAPPAPSARTPLPPNPLNVAAPPPPPQPPVESPQPPVADFDLETAPPTLLAKLNIRLRDFLAAGIGAGVVLLVEGIIWLFFRLLSALGLF
jgi:hypothetical protein